MANPMVATVGVERVKEKLASWRERHGGRGRPIPQELWAEAADVAAIAGVEVTARVLGMDRERLARRVGERSSTGSSVVAPRSRRSRASAAFVELDAERVLAGGKTVVRLTRRAGEQLEIEVEGAAMDVAAVARAFLASAR